MGYIAVRRTITVQRRGETARPGGEDAVERYADWRRVHLGLARFVEETRSFRGLPGGSSDGAVLALARNERAFLAVAGAHLIESRPSGGRFVGGSPGVWLRLADGTRAEVGGSGGTYVPGFDELTSVDVGGLVVTDRRAVLQGADRDHEWLFRNLSAVHHDPEAPWTALEVSDRPETSGFFYGHADVPLVRFRLMLAIAVYGGTVGRLRAELRAQPAP